MITYKEQFLLWFNGLHYEPIYEKEIIILLLLLLFLFIYEYRDAFKFIFNGLVGTFIAFLVIGYGELFELIKINVKKLLRFIKKY